jgi:hypothetical protein
MSRNVLVAIVAMLVFVVVAGAVYLELAASAGAKDLVWEVSRSVTAGEMLTSDNVQQQRIPHAADNLNYFTGKLRAGVSRAAHDMGAGTILFQNDVLDQDLALVNLTFKTPPQLSPGQTIDVYVQVGSSTVLVGRRLVVNQVSGGTTGNNIAVLVPASDEPHWISLQASNAALFAARSTGIGVPQLRAQTMQDAIAALSGGATGVGTAGGVGTITPPTPAPAPTPSPTKKP